MSDEAPEGRSAKQIIELITLHPENALQILSDLNDYEHDQMTQSTILVGLQRARGLSCYETLAAYYMGAERENNLDAQIVHDLQSRGDQLFGMLNAKALADRVLSRIGGVDLEDVVRHFDHLEGLDSDGKDDMS